MLCISRYTDETHAQHFGNGRNKFYLEFRCNRQCSKNEKYCTKCCNKSPNKLQQSRKFNHGDINEPIPDSSHIFGGKWYNEGVVRWGLPPSEIIEFAIKYSSEARQGFIPIDIPSEIITLPPLPTIKLKKPKLALDLTSEPALELTAELISEPVLEPVLEPALELTAELTALEPALELIAEPASELIAELIAELITVVPKKVRKPKVASESSITLTDHSEPKKQVRKKPAVTPYSTLVSTIPQLVHKEVSLPTHIESKMEEVDSSGYSIQYIKLTVFDANGISYFKDAIKNKLYKKVKDKIGVYIGRWNPDTDSIIVDIPDSDDE
jgi:hypothetical protein